MKGMAVPGRFDLSPGNARTPPILAFNFALCILHFDFCNLT